ncbi:MAG: hypothetical protein MUC53_09495 [Candidatus Contendobacter sp.]|nr:hypothetical protein [Candidatus Contendobacter sp.]
MNATIRIRRAQLCAAMTSQCAHFIAALQEGHRLVYASAGSTQRAALAGIADYQTTHVLPARPAGNDSHDALDPQYRRAGQFHHSSTGNSGLVT